MQKRKLLWRLLPPYIIAALAALAIPSFITSTLVRQFHIKHVEQDLFSRAKLLEEYFYDSILDGDGRSIDDLCKKLGAASGTRITVISADGLVLGDSLHTPSDMDNHVARPEILAARANGSGSSARFSDTVETEMAYTAIAVKREGEIAGYIRTAIPVESVNRLISDMRKRILVGGAIVVAVGILASFLGYMRIAIPLAALKRQAEKHAEGNLESGQVNSDIEEIHSLAEAINKTAGELDSRIKTMARQRNELESVLTSMVEGIVAVDMDGMILNINNAACGMMGSSCDCNSARGRYHFEVISNEEATSFIAEILEKGINTEKTLYASIRGQNKALHIHGKRLTDESGNPMGALVAINDITKIKKLENMRRDFVANVSHELKTPITSMKGAVENLLDGALDNREDATRFLNIINNHSDRMAAIINDLLALSRLDSDSGSGVIDTEETLIQDILRVAARECDSRVKDKCVALKTTCQDGLCANVNGRLLEQAVVNLLDNAVKYSDPGASVSLEAFKTGPELIIKVSDQGIGIESEHLPRVFERFYRVDKARSRKMGGTGLGLAIVKHIAQAHGGRAEAQSVYGEGSVFSIHIPA